MPEMDGPTLLREVRKTLPDLKIIFVSGYAEDAFRRTCPKARIPLPAEAVLAEAARRRGEGDARKVSLPQLSLAELVSALYD